MTDTDSQQRPELALYIQTDGDAPTTPQIRLVGEEWIFNDAMSIEDWKNGLKTFKQFQSNIKMGFAQYLAFGEIKFGKDAVGEALTQLEFDLPTVTTAIDINSVPPEMRQPGLTAEHLVVLARAQITPAKKKEWAKIASTQSLSAQQLKSSIARGEVVDPTIAKKDHHGVVGIHGIHMEFDIWLRRMNGVEGILKQAPDVIAEAISELKIFTDVHAALVKGAGKKPKKAPRKPVKGPAKKSAKKAPPKAKKPAKAKRGAKASQK